MSSSGSGAARPMRWWFGWNVRTAWLFGIVLMAWGISTSWERNAIYPMTDWRSNLRADAAGYYIYLPGAFRYGFIASAVDTALIDKTSHGFGLDPVSDRIHTKYYYGTALLELPFYVATELMIGWNSTDGFTEDHRLGLEVAGVVYWVLGLMLLGSALHRWWPAPLWALLFVLLAISFGSNVLYYAVRAPAYSHIYSFFTICLAFWAMITGVLGDRSRWKRWVFHSACALILLIRPVDLIAVVGLYAWIWFQDREILRQWRFWILQAVMLMVIATPQLCYWRFAYGQWIMDSYAGEGFTHWNAPRIFKELFAPANGLLPYAPVFVLLPFGLWKLHRARPATTWLILGVWATLIYVCASWWAWDFGCGFGCRPAVQYMPFVAFGVLPFLTCKEEPWVRARFAIIPLAALLMFVHFRASMQAIPCFVGEGAWDWDRYAANIVTAFFDKAH